MQGLSDVDRVDFSEKSPFELLLTGKKELILLDMVQYGVGSEISSKDTIKTNRQNTKGMRVISKSNNESEFTSACLLPDGHVVGATESGVRKNNIVWKAKSNEKARSLSFVRNGKYIVCLCEDSSSSSYSLKVLKSKGLKEVSSLVVKAQVKDALYTLLSVGTSRVVVADVAGSNANPFDMFKISSKGSITWHTRFRVTHPVLSMCVRHDCKNDISCYSVGVRARSARIFIISLKYHCNDLNQHSRTNRYSLRRFSNFTSALVIVVVMTLTMRRSHPRKKRKKRRRS